MEINPGQEKRNKSGERKNLEKRNETGSARWHISIGHKCEIEA